MIINWSYKLNVAQIISFFAHWDFFRGNSFPFDLDTNFPRLHRPGTAQVRPMLKRKGLAVGSSRNNTGTKAPERRHAQGFFVCCSIRDWDSHHDEAEVRVLGG